MARRLQQRSKKIDVLRWVGFNAFAPSFSSGSPVAVLILTAGSAPETIMRTRGQLVSYVPTLVAPGISAQVAVGIHIVPEGTGTTILQDPLDDANADWFYYTRFVIGHEESVTDNIGSPVLAGYRETIDVKAMRIGKADTEVQIVFAQLTLAATMSVAVNVGGRFLLGS